MRQPVSKQTPGIEFSVSLKTDRQPETSLTLVYRADDPPGSARLHRCHDFRRINAITGGPLRSTLTFSSGRPAVCSARTSAAPGIFDMMPAARSPAPLAFEIVTENFKGDVGPDAGNKLIETQLNGLGKAKHDPGHFLR